MIDVQFLEQAIALLTDIENSPEKKEWCQKYSVYAMDESSLECELKRFLHQGYDVGLVITNYREVMEEQQLEERLVATVPKDWLDTLNYEGTLARIAYHFRRDHFCEGSLINTSIASGVMLQMLLRLQELQSDSR